MVIWRKRLGNSINTEPFLFISGRCKRCIDEAAVPNLEVCIHFIQSDHKEKSKVARNEFICWFKEGPLWYDANICQNFKTSYMSIKS